MSEAAKPIESLHPETIAASKERKLSGNFEGKRLLKILGELAKIDESVGAMIAKRTKIAIICAVTTFIGFAISLLAGSWELGALPLATGALTAVFAVQAHKMKSRDDLLDDFRLLIRPVLRDVLDDLDPAKKVRARFDLSGIHPGKQVSKRTLPPGPYIALTETMQRDPWCEIRLPLADGSQMTLEVINEYYEFERRYKGRRGRIKWKSKWRKEAEVSATLLPPPGVRWNESAKVAGPDEKLKSFDKDGVTGKSLQHSWSFKGTNEQIAGFSPPSREVVGMMLRLHNALAGKSPEGKAGQ